ncbi:6,7-dimethyl-8-ribityllumazine synthase [Canibacter sp. lx-72]|uniref:6,7-dimethyl-8-ribityllumazine synthase n=1 Tax=Canibacter zhuwentaonis TaxID=2837491 RepID=UPI001BDC4CE6|nr:6,7-dimethyl-8-ribityllumazine synthase [Canibacter zhuwentaonis]MBT1018146.1 6,7-dimethyl-8-ribityllumazine synthase [Canibacter zhuwentaonis]MBT1035319.1 6,7-dimethyl-8-ribityllumazine synthase [Canibacter zhuwentaonis]
MSGAGAAELKVHAPGLNVAVIAGSWYTHIIDSMVADALATITEAGATAELFHVAGSFELPLAAQAAAQAGFDAIVCLGVIVRGGTPHFDYVCDAVTGGLTRVQLDFGKPVGFGVLTVDNVEQAVARSGASGSAEAKGREAAAAALHLVGTLKNIAQFAR